MTDSIIQPWAVYSLMGEGLDMATEMHTFCPDDLMSSLGYLDANILDDAECALIEGVNIDDDAQLETLMRGWMRKNFTECDERNRAAMIEILRQSQHWSERQLAPVFSRIALPSGQMIIDVLRFMSALRAEFLSVLQGHGK